MNFFIFYLTFNLVLSVAAAGLLLFTPLVKPFSRQLRLHYWVVILVLLTPLAAAVRGPAIFKPIVKVWSGTGAPLGVASPSSKGTLSVQKLSLPVPADDLFLFVFGLSVGALAFAATRLAGGLMRLRQILGEAVRIRAIGRVEVLVSPSVRIPFSFRSVRRAYVVLPEDLLSNSNSLKMSLVHELQHHRQRDTLWAYVFLGVRAFCFFNPFAHFWNHCLGETQEFACDEALAGRPGFPAQDYARCLIEVAETAWVGGEVPEGAAGMILLSRGQLLNRRIQVMFKEKQKSSAWMGIASFGLIASLMTGTALAAKNLVQDRRVTLAQAKDWAGKVAPKGAAFPVVINEEVLKYLNQFVGTVEGRERMRLALRRMQPYRVLVEAKIAEYNVPPELMAIPIIESGYQNLEDRNVEGWGAGLWMIIESTARAYGLTVTPHRDERLDEPKETDAAMRYILANHARFSDWSLAVLAYNAGENAVQKAIFATGSRDPWVLIRQAGLSEEARNYLPKLMAAIVIMRNPSTVE